MATKFGYVERQATNNIDWSAIGSQVVKNLQEEAKIREDKKDAIDQASRDMAETLRNAPTGDNLTMNEFTLDYANNAQQLLLQQDKLLKSGLLNPKDYSVVRANLNESTNELFNLSKEYQNQYTIKMERMKSGKSQELETFLMASAEGLANLKNGKALIDPDTGVVSIGTWADGKMDGDPASYATVNEVRNRINSTYDKYDLPVQISTQVEFLGGNKWVEIIKAKGGGDINQVITNMDQQERSDYTQWENNVISSMMNNPFHVTSILTDNINITKDGKLYDFTFSEEEFKNDKTDSLIFLDRSEDPNGQPVFKPGQEESVKLRLQQDVRAQLAKDQAISVSQQSYKPQKSQFTYSIDQKKDIQEDTINLFGQLWYGNAEEKRVAAQSLRGLNQAIARIDAPAGGDGILITYTDGRQQPVKYGSSQENFILEGVNFALSQTNKIDNVAEQVGRSSIDKTLELNTEAFTATELARPYDPNEQMYRELFVYADTLSKKPIKQTTMRGDKETTTYLPSEYDNFIKEIQSAEDDGVLDLVYKRVLNRPIPTQDREINVGEITNPSDGNPRYIP